MLVPRETSSVTLGVVSATSVMSSAPWRSSCSPEKAVTATGTSSSSSLRRRAVTMIVWSLASAAVLWVCWLACVAGLVFEFSWAAAGVVMSAAAATVPSKAARSKVTRMSILPLAACAIASAVACSHNET